jgi:hypothetical protein
LASFTTIRQNQPLGLFPLSHVARFSEAFVAMFLDRVLAVVPDGQQDAECSSIRASRLTLHATMVW